VDLAEDPRQPLTILREGIDARLAVNALKERLGRVFSSICIDGDCRIVAHSHHCHHEGHHWHHEAAQADDWQGACVRHSMHETCNVMFEEPHA